MLGIREGIVGAKVKLVKRLIVWHVYIRCSLPFEMFQRDVSENDERTSSRKLHPHECLVIRLNQSQKSKTMAIDNNEHPIKIHIKCDSLAYACCARRIHTCVKFNPEHAGKSMTCIVLSEQLTSGKLE